MIRGVALLADPSKLLGYVWDLSDPDAPEIRAFARNCDTELLSPFSGAVGKGTPDALLDAANRAEALLRDNRHIQAEVAHELASSVARGISGHTRVSYVSAPVSPQGGATVANAPSQGQAPGYQSSQDYDHPPISGAPSQPAYVRERTVMREAAGSAPASQAYVAPQPPTAQQPPQAAKPRRTALAVAVTLALVAVCALVVYLGLRQQGAATGTPAASADSTTDAEAAAPAYDQRFVGTWAWVEADFIVNGATYPVTLPLGFASMTLYDDGTLSGNSLAIEFEGTWSSEGDTLYLQANYEALDSDFDESSSVTIVDGAIVTRRTVNETTEVSGIYRRVDPSELAPFEDWMFDEYNSQIEEYNRQLASAGA